jgi:DNA-binding FadR family transcriptional regulator
LSKLRDLLRSDRFAARKRLPPERTLADELGVSRSGLRKALAVLEQEEKIWRHVGRGTFIGAFPVADPEDLSGVSAATNPAEIMEARLILEPKLASLAALRATKNDLAEMDGYLKKSKEAGDTVSFEKWDELLHRSIAKASDNSLLISLFAVIQTMRQSNIWGRLKVASVTNERRKTYCAQHRGIVEALKDRHAGMAERLMREHLEAVRTHLIADPYHE